MGKKSQNGYSACDSSVIAKYTIPNSGGVTINLRKGDVSVVLLDFFGWYAKNIEPLHQNDTGGYNCRTIEGSNTTSNHGSGTAGDVRWNDHARGKKNQGYSSAEVTKINAKLKEYAGVIRWGNNYNGTPDAMHFEINAGPAAVKVQADRIRKANAPKPTTPKPTTPAPKPTGGLKEFALGSRTLKEGVEPGTDVKFVQEFIGSKHMGPADGKPGPQFTKGVKWYQHMRGTGADGVVSKGGPTWHAMGH